MKHLPDFDTLKKYIHFKNGIGLYELGLLHINRELPTFFNDLFDLLDNEYPNLEFKNEYDLLFFAGILVQSIYSCKQNKELSKKPNGAVIFKEDYKSIQEILKKGIDSIKVTSKGADNKKGMVYEIKDNYILGRLFDTLRKDNDLFIKWNADINKNFSDVIEKNRKKQSNSYDRDSLHPLKHLYSYLEKETNFPFSSTKEACQFLADFAKICGFDWKPFEKRERDNDVYIQKYIL